MCNCPNICHLNDCSIFVCISSLKFAVLGTVYELDIICVTKTWLKSSVLNNLRLPGFCFLFGFLFGFELNRHGSGVSEHPTICHLNDCSIFVCISSLKFAVLGIVSYIYVLDIICVTETWLKSSVLNNLRLPVFCSLFGFEPNCLEAEFLAYAQCNIFC